MPLPENSESLLLNLSIPPFSAVILATHGFVSASLTRSAGGSAERSLTPAVSSSTRLVLYFSTAAFAAFFVSSLAHSTLATSRAVFMDL